MLMKGLSPTGLPSTGQVSNVYRQVVVQTRRAGQHLVIVADYLFMCVMDDAAVIRGYRFTDQSAIDCVRFVARARAVPLGWYPISLAICRTRRRVSAETGTSTLLRTRDTVASETFAHLATSLIEIFT